MRAFWLVNQLWVIVPVNPWKNRVSNRHFWGCQLCCYSYKLKYVFRLEGNASRVVSQNSITPWGTNNMIFRLARDQVVLLETAANLWASRSKANDLFAVFSSFELGGITKHCTRGKQWVLFPLDFNVSRGNKTHCFPRGQSLSAHWPLMKVFLQHALLCHICDRSFNIISV